MSQVKHTKTSLGRTSFIQRSLSQTEGPKCDHKPSSIEKCSQKVQELQKKLFETEEELANVNKEIESLQYNIPIKLANLKKSNNKEIQTQKTFLRTVYNNFTKSLTDYQVLTLKEEHLMEKMKKLEIQNEKEKIETEIKNYNLFKKGYFQGYLESDVNQELKEPCHLDEIEKLWSSIQEAENELLKWQNISCIEEEVHQRNSEMKEEDINEYLISFIRDALFHFVMDEVSAKTKQDQLDVLLSLYDFNEKEIEIIKMNKSWSNGAKNILN